MIHLIFSNTGKHVIDTGKHVIWILGLEGLVTTNAQTKTLGIYPKGGLSTLRSKFQEFRLN